MVPLVVSSMHLDEARAELLALCWFLADRI